MKVRGISVVLIAVMAGCSSASAAPDVSSDFDCAWTAAYFHEYSKDVPTATAEHRQAFYILNQWYASSWQIANPGQPMAQTKPKVMPMLEAMDRNPAAYKDALRSCAERAARDPKFSKFVEMMQ